MQDTSANENTKEFAFVQTFAELRSFAKLVESESIQMPVSFLTEEQRSRYGNYAGEPTSEQLARFFHLDDADRDFISIRRGDHNRLGFALQLCTVRFLGTFLEDPNRIPAAVVSNVAHQLAISDLSCYGQYCVGEQRWEHAVEIRTRYGYQDFSAWSAQFRLNRWLYALCWTGTDRPSILFDRATAWLISHKVLLPGVSVLERLVARLRGRVEERLWRLLISGLTPQSNARLEQLLKVLPGERKSQLDQFRSGPTRRSVPELIRALQRVEDVRNLAVDVSVSARLPRSRVLELARFAATAKATAIERMGPERRAATLVAWVSTLQATAQDDALDVLDIVLTDMFSKASKAGIKARLRTLKDLDAAAVQAALVSKIILDASVADSEVRDAVFKLLSRSDLQASVQQIDDLVRPPQDVYYKELQTNYRRIRRFLPLLLRTVMFGSSPAGQPLMEAIGYLKGLDGNDKKTAPDAPVDIVDSAWHGHVIRDETVDPQAYTLCFLDRLRKGLRRRDIFVTPSVRYADPRIGLLEGEAWEGARPFICRSLDLPTSADEALGALRQELDQTYSAVALNFPNNSAARIEQVDGKDDLILTGLDKLDEPASLIALRKEVQHRMPRAELPEILLEIAARTGFTNEFTHISERESRAADLITSICAVLLAQACNTGTGPLERNDIPALRRSRLSWVNQNYIRNETLTAANACLVAAQNRIPLVLSWGGGEWLPPMVYVLWCRFGPFMPVPTPSISAWDEASPITTWSPINSRDSTVLWCPARYATVWFYSRSCSNSRPN